ncbi:MAG: hypothetical protein ACLGI7_04000 [Gammaproteobacteria bacterium]
MTDAVPDSTAPSAWVSVSTLPGQEAVHARDGNAALWTDLAIGLILIALLIAWVRYLGTHPPTFERNVRRRPRPVHELDPLLREDD